MASPGSSQPPASAVVSQLTVANAFALLGAYIAYSVLHQFIYYRFLHSLAQFDGPFWGSFTRLWIAYHNIKEDECAVYTKLHKKYGTLRMRCSLIHFIPYRTNKGENTRLIFISNQSGPVIRITPTQLLVSDATRLPDIYHRQANKSKHYITGSFGKIESVFNMQDWRQHAYHRKLIAGPVCKFQPAQTHPCSVSVYRPQCVVPATARQYNPIAKDYA